MTDIIIIAISIIGIYVVIKSQRLSRIKSFMYDLFWVNKLANNRNAYVRFVSKAYVFLYMFYIFHIVLSGLVYLDMEYIVSILIWILMCPITYRINMKFLIWITSTKIMRRNSGKN